MNETNNANPRAITDHRCNDLNDGIRITATDPVGPGGANHQYRLDVIAGAPHSGGMTTGIKFQFGPVKEAGFNGISNESLIAVVIDRLRGFQHKRKADGSYDFNSRGEYASKENAQSLTYLEEALMWQQKRTRDRQSRGVEGTSTV